MRIYSKNQVGRHADADARLAVLEGLHPHERLTYLRGAGVCFWRCRGRPPSHGGECLCEGFQVRKDIGMGVWEYSRVEIDCVRYDYQVTSDEDWARNKLAEYGDRAVLIGRHSTSRKATSLIVH